VCTTRHCTIEGLRASLSDTARIANVFRRIIPCKTC
jgi:hypothetical protein